MKKKEKNITYEKPKNVRYFLATYVTVVVLLLIQLLVVALLFMAIFIRSTDSMPYALVSLLGYLVSLVVVLIVINRRCDNAFKLAWVVPILLLPGVGGAAYLIVQNGSVHNLAKKKILKSEAVFKDRRVQHTFNAFPKSYGFSRLPAYLASEGFPSYGSTNTLYLPTGETFHERLLLELEKAEKFIFLEFFIIHEGEMWDSVLKILKKKAAAGVTVRLLYDGMGSLKTLPRGYAESLREFGIQAKMFNPFVPIFVTTQNNRDHRKIVVIDGKTGFTGGINLSDEYINVVERFGHWKDSGICLKGAGVQTLTRLFLETWYTKFPPDEDPEIFFPVFPAFASAGYTAPYADSPLFETTRAKTVYLEMINNAKNYVYVTTPYLVPGDELLAALCRAAKSGVDVRLITPFHGDKKIVHVISRSYYRELLEAGVRVYEYSPGFIHSKTMVADDTICSVGSSNLDYRSLYLHYECGVVCIDTPAVAQLKNDHLQTEAKCREIALADTKKAGAFKRFFISLMRLFEPLI